MGHSDRVVTGGGGVRVDWHQVPDSVRSAVEDACGSRVVTAETQRGGFSPGLATRVRCADGNRFFIKAGTCNLNPYSVDLHRREAVVLTKLDRYIGDRRLPIPRLHATVDVDSWFGLVLDDVHGRHPVTPWQDEDLRTVITMLEELAAALTPAPIAVPPIAAQYASSLSGWRTLAGARGADSLDPWSRAHLDELVALEETWTACSEGETLLHTDVRWDNILLTDTGGFLVDWAHACRGAAFVEVVLLAPSVAMQGGPQPADLVAMSSAARRADRHALMAIVCALAGYFTENSLRPAPPGLPAARGFQAAQGEVARCWLRQLW
jgi:hypothetical protein